ncbi:MAG TPA: response regulator [Gaiellaceae bacterium]|nr:response regulator [Gaiellaceae bacterium]
MPRSAKTILICEDDQHLRQLIRVVIGEGVQVVEAHDGDEAVELALALRPQLIILDLMLPKRSGSEVLAAIRPKLSPDDTHIIVVSAWPDADAAALDAGADGFLSKPFEPDELEAMVNNVLDES